MFDVSTFQKLRRTHPYLLAPGTTQISSYFTKHWTKFLTNQTGNYPVTCFVSKPSRITLVELSIINTSYQKLPFGSGRVFSSRTKQVALTSSSCWRDHINTCSVEWLDVLTEVWPQYLLYRFYYRQLKSLCNNAFPRITNDIFIFCILVTSNE